MLNPVGRAGPAIVTPLLKGNDTAGAQANWSQIKSLVDSAKRIRVPLTIQLPVGLFYCGDGTQPILKLSESHAGVVFQGMGAGKTVLVPGTDVTAQPLSFLSTRVPYSSPGTLNPSLGTITSIPPEEIAQYLEDDVVYIWAFNAGNNRSVSYRRTVELVAPRKAKRARRRAGSKTTSKQGESL
jgi:hypothetical protein